MAFNNSLTARLDELRSRNTQRITNDSSNNSSNTATPFRYSGSFMSPTQPLSNPTNPAETPNLQRRFTGDLTKMSSMAPIGQAPGSMGTMTSNVSSEASDGIPAAVSSCALNLQRAF